MSTELLKDIYESKQFRTDHIKKEFTLDEVTDKDKLKLAYRILTMIVLVYILNLIAYFVKPELDKLFYANTLIFSNIITGITVHYFRKN